MSENKMSEYEKFFGKRSSEMSDYEKDKQRKKLLQEYAHKIITVYLGSPFSETFSRQKLYWGDVLSENDIPTEYVDEVKNIVTSICLGGGIKFVEGESGGFLKKLFKKWKNYY